MKFIQVLTLLFIGTSTVIAQNTSIKEVLNYPIDKTTAKTFFKKGFPSIYLDQEGQYIILNNHEQMLVLNNDGSVKLRKNHLEPIERFTAVALDLVKSAYPNDPNVQMIPEISFEEGAAYYVFDEQDIAIIMEYNLKKNNIYALDLKTGDIKWSKENYRYTTEANSQLAKALAGVAVSKFLTSVVMETNLLATNSAFIISGASINSQLLFSQHASPEALSWITPIEGKNQFLLKTNDALVSLDLNTGEENWTYESPVNVAYSTVRNDELVLVNYTASYLSSSEKSIVSLNINSGEENWKSTYLSEYLPNRTSVVGDRLILDYYGTEIFDLNNGERLLLSIDEGIVKAQNTMMNVLGGGDNNDQMAQMVEPALIDDKYVYTSTYTSMGKKYPNQGAGKVQVQKYDLSTGEMVWESDKLDRGLTMENVLENDLVLGKIKGLNKRSFIIVDKNTGKLKVETDPVASLVFREKPADLWMNDVVFRGGKKEIFAFNPVSWSMIKEIDTGGDVGKLQTIGINDKGIIAICDKGVAFYDSKAELADKIELKNIKGSAQHGDDLLLFTKNEMIKINVNNPQQQSAYDESPEKSDKHWMFSPHSKYVLTVDANELTLLQL